MVLFRRPGLFAAVVGCAVCALTCHPVWGQGLVDGALHGSVLDANGRAVGGASVMVGQVETGRVWTVKAGGEGTFLVAHLTPGEYTIQLVAEGFAASGVMRVGVGLGETREVVGRLRIAGGETAITVVAEAEAAGRGGAMGAEGLGRLPAPGRRWQDFALTADGVMPDQDADGLLSVHGLPSTQNNVLVDGAEQNQSFGSVPVGTGSDAGPDAAEDSDSADLSVGPSQGLARSRHAGIAYSFSQAAVREFRVSTQNYSALTGNAAGGVVTTVSKSGTSEMHGAGFLVLRSQAFAAANPFSIATSYAGGVVTNGVVKPHDLRENFGGTLGGPVARTWLRQRPVYFFAAYDQQKRGFPAVSSPANPEFYSLTPVQAALLQTRGVKRAAVESALEYVSSLTGKTNRRADQEIEFGRLDWTAAARQELGVQFNRARWNSPAGLTDAPVVARGRASLGNASGSLDAVLLRATTTLNAHWVNQVRVQAARDVQMEAPQANLPQEPAIGPGGMAPEVAIGPDGLIFGTPAGLARQAYPDERRVDAGDTVSVQRGRSLLELGVQFSAVRDRVATLANGAGTFRYDSTRTTANAGGLVDFITDYTFNVSAYPNGGCPSITAATHLFCFTSYGQSFGEQRVAFTTEDWAGFVEETWRPRGGLMVHAGVRYEYVALPRAIAPNAALDAVFGSQAATSVLPVDKNNLGPRVGVSWEPFGAGRGVVRLGYGAYFGRLAGATIRSALADTAMAGSTTRVRITPSAETLCPQVMGQGFGYPCSFLEQPVGVVATTASAMVFDRRFRLPTVQQGSVEVERSVGRGVSLSAAYEMNFDRQLASSTDLNILPATEQQEFVIQGGTGARGIAAGETFVVPFYTTRVTKAYGPVTEITSHVNASYHGLVLVAAVRGLGGFSGRASYSWSRAIDYGPNATATPRTDGQFDPFANGYDKGLSSLNYPQALRFSGVWRAEERRDGGFGRRALTGWEVAPVVLVHSGRPYSYEIYGGPELNGGHPSINGSGGALYLPTVGRNTLRLPVSANADLRVGKAFGMGRMLGEPLTVRLAAEVFNVTNRRNVSSVEERAFLVGAASGGVTPLVFQDAAEIAKEGLNARAFGTVTAASSGLARERQMQLSLHVEF